MSASSNKPEFYDRYELRVVDPGWLAQRVKPKRHIGLDPDLCILCRACEDSCPWNCIFMLSGAIVAGSDSPALKRAATDAAAVFVIDDTECTRCGICVERCPSDALFFMTLEGERAPRSR
ncbi:MAG: 4Fe-4S binding protein [Acidobacteria bacterium]|nr:4Fe-4S binding protein [Acidobacteriota bacterium]